MRCKRLSLIFACTLFTTPLSITPLSANNYYEHFSSLPKEDKVMWSNVAGVALISTWGITTWDYGSQSPHMEGDAWFGKNDKHGGMDKLGHFYTNFTLSHGLSYLYQSWGYETQRATLLGSLSAFGLMGFMEFGDSFGGHGFSRQDFIMNTLGAITGYIFLTRPELTKRIDIRVEYIPGGQRDIFTDYENMKFIVALKLDGIQSVRNRYLKYLDLQLGYYTRHYSAESQENKERNIYIAVGINLSHVLHNMSHKKTATFFNYYQMPYTYIDRSKNLNE